MIDFHAHILPEMDDGAENIEESVFLLNQLSSQNVDTVIATPHYSIKNESDAEFLKRRGEKYTDLVSQHSCVMPKILLGAEVAYFPGIHKASFIRELRVEQSRLLLIEMPFDTWSDKVISDIVQLSHTEDIVPVLAHIERYYKFVSFGELEYLSENGVLFQMNCTALFERATRRKTKKLLQNGQIQFIGTDCHYLPDRYPCMDKFEKYICDDFGRDYLEEFYEKQNSLFQMNNI